MDINQFGNLFFNFKTFHSFHDRELFATKKAASLVPTNLRRGSVGRTGVEPATP